MTSHKPQWRLSLAAAVCAALVFSVPACAHRPPPGSGGRSPGQGGKKCGHWHRQADADPAGLDRLELKTEPVAAGAGTEIRLPYGALMYDANGKTWVYTNPAPRVFERQEVAVSRVEDGVVTATAGPPAGTQVVTVGAAELFGAEFNTGK